MIGAIGWKYVVPPKVQLPEPPEVIPSPAPWLYSGPPLSPGSAHTVVWIRPLTVVPSAYVTVELIAVMVPPCTPEVVPLR